MVLKMIVIAYAQSHADWYQCFRSVKGNDKKDENEIIVFCFANLKMKIIQGFLCVFLIGEFQNTHLT